MNVRRDNFKKLDRRKRSGFLKLAALAALVASLAQLASVPAFAATRLVVSPQGPYTTISDALRDARDGDTIEVRGGTYRGNLVIEKSVTLEGVDQPILDGENRGTIVTLNAPDTTLRGFILQNSGVEPDQNHAGVTANAPRALVEKNIFRQVLFGVFFAQAPESIARANDITSRDEYDSGRKGDGIRLWASPRARVENNHVHNARDIVIWYSEDVHIADNFIETGRYGVHLMYCDGATIENNRLLNNSVGIYTMYSKNVVIQNNDLRGQRGPSGYALGFKDADNVDAQRNILVDNRGGIFLDGTPFTPKGYARFQNNVLAFNDIAVTVMPAVKGVEFSDNVFWENAEQMAVYGGGGKFDANRWQNNFWSDYAGLDANNDGIGDTPYLAEKFFENMTDREPMLRALLYSPAAQALEFAATSFPLVKPLPKFQDAAPQIAPPPLPANVELARGKPGETFLLAALLVGAAMGIGALGVARRETRPRAKPNSTNVIPEMSDSENVVVSAHAVGKMYGKTRVLEQVNFELGAGQALALWGPNGAGKTTLVKALLGLIPFEGELTVANVRVTRDAKHARGRIGYVPQEVMFYDWTVRATMEFYARLKRVESKRIDALLEQLGLQTHARKNVSALSGGLKQRLALALALLADPPILLLDEPTANLDTQARAEYLKLIAAQKRAGKTILFASHRLEEVETLADRVLWLDSAKPARLLTLSEWRAASAPVIELTLWLGEGQRERANEFLNANGWDAHLNGRSAVIVRAHTQEKLRALQALQAHGFQVDDFEIERAL